MREGWTILDFLDNYKTCLTFSKCFFFYNKSLFPGLINYMTYLDCQKCYIQLSHICWLLKIKLLFFFTKGVVLLQSCFYCPLYQKYFIQTHEKENPVVKIFEKSFFIKLSFHYYTLADWLIYITCMFIHITYNFVEFHSKPIKHSVNLARGVHLTLSLCIPNAHVWGKTNIFPFLTLQIFSASSFFCDLQLLYFSQNGKIFIALQINQIKKVRYEN